MPKTKKLSETPIRSVDSSSPKFQSLAARLKAKKISFTTGRSMQQFQNAKPVVSTGCYFLDFALGRMDPVYGNGGVVQRSYMELFGTTGSGKSSLNEMMIAQHHKRFPDGWVAGVYTDEPPWDRLERYGVDLDRFIALNAYEPQKDKSQSMLAEERMMELCELSSEQEFVYVFVDMVKGLVPSTSLFIKGDTDGKVKDFFTRDVAIRAQLLDRVFDRIKFVNIRSTFVLLNALTESISDDMIMGSGDRIKTSGGRRKEFEAIYRIKCDSRRWEDKKEHDVIKGYYPQVGLEEFFRIQKNRYSPMSGNRKVHTKLHFESFGYTNAEDLITLGSYVGPEDEDERKKANEPISKSGNWYTIRINGKEKGLNGRNGAADFLRKRPKLMEKIYKMLMPRHTEIFKNKDGSAERIKPAHILDQDILSSADKQVDKGKLKKRGKSAA